MTTLIEIDFCQAKADSHDVGQLFPSQMTTRYKPQREKEVGSQMPILGPVDC